MRPWPGKVQLLAMLNCLQWIMCKTGQRSLRNPNIGIKAINNQDPNIEHEFCIPYHVGVSLFKVEN